MFESTGVMTRVELEARNEVKWETYTKKIQIEARVLGDLAMNHVIPVAIGYQTRLIDNVFKMKSLFDKEEAEKLSAENMAHYQGDFGAYGLYQRACRCHGRCAQGGQ